MSGMDLSDDVSTSPSTLVNISGDVSVSSWTDFFIFFMLGVSCSAENALFFTLLVSMQCLDSWTASSDSTHLYSVTVGLGTENIEKFFVHGSLFSCVDSWLSSWIALADLSWPVMWHLEALLRFYLHIVCFSHKFWLLDTYGMIPYVFQISILVFCWFHSKLFALKLLLPWWTVFWFCWETKHFSTVAWTGAEWMILSSYGDCALFTDLVMIWHVFEREASLTSSSIWDGYMLEEGAS